MRIGQSLNNVW